MKAFSIRVISHPREDGSIVKFLSIFLFRPNVSENDIDNEILEALSKESLIDAVHFVGYKENISQIPSWFTSESALEARIKKFVVNPLEDIVAMITFDEQTGHHIALKLDQTSHQSTHFISVEKRFVLQEIFEKNNGLMEPSKGFHYEKPSGKHVEKFIRVSNLLEKGDATSLIAFWLLPHAWNKNITEIVVDTTGILPIAITLTYEISSRNGFRNGLMPLIWSHQSYGGLENLNIAQPQSTLILISASSSGGLREKLLAKGAISDHIVTLFYVGPIVGEDTILLCDLTKNEKTNPYGIPILHNHDKPNCPLCSTRSLPVNLVGDQFSFEPPSITEIDVLFSDLPESDRQEIDLLASTGFFKVHKSMGYRNFEIYLDVSAMFPADLESVHEHSRDHLNSLRKLWDRNVNRGLVANLKKIISASYEFSDNLAESALGSLKHHIPNAPVEIINVRDLASAKKIQDAASLVVVACLDDSHELMGINRDLRSIHPNGNACYVSPVIRSSSKIDKERLRSNLTFGQNKANTFSLFKVLEIDLPECSVDNSWSTERVALNDLVDWAVRNGKEIPSCIEDRVSYLERITSSGMSDNLFWESPTGEPLAVRSDFTLISTYGGKRKVSQADVFVAISSVLHHLRKGSNGKRLVYKPYERSVISPSIFQRFNDGTIQAAILRASRNQELCYSNCDDRISEAMKQNLLLQVMKHKSGDGEALLEFLLALLTKRLSLKKDHQLEVCTAILESELSQHFKLFAEYISHVTAQSQYH